MTARARMAEAGKMLAFAGMLAVALLPLLVFADAWDGSNAAAKFLALCGGAGVAWAGAGLVLASRASLPRWRPADFAVVVYVVWLAVAAVASGDIAFSLSGYRPYWDGLVAAGAAAAAYAACRVAFAGHAESSRALRMTLRWSSAAFLAMAFASLLGVLGVPLMRSVVFEGSRLGALIHQPTFLAAVIAVWIVPIGAWSVAELRRPGRGPWAWVGAAAAAAMTAMLVATGGRAGVFGATAAVGAFALLGAGTWRVAVRRGAVALAVALAVAAPVVVMRSGGADLAKFARAVDASQFVSRSGAWATSLRAVSARPVVGSGPGSFVFAHQRHLSVEEARQLKGKVLLDPHDWVLATAVAAGWPGAAAALGVTVCGVLAAWRARRSRGAALAAACGVIGHGVAVLATPNAFVIFPSALLMLAFAETLSGGERKPAGRVLPAAPAVAAGVLMLALALGTVGWGARIFVAERSYGTSRATFGSAGLARAVRTAPEVAEYARYAANAKVVAAKSSGRYVQMSEAEDALLALAEAHPRDPLALLSAGALVDLAAVAESQAATDHADRLTREAVPVLARAVEAAPQSAEARLRYSEALLYAGDAKAAAAQFQEVRRIGMARTAQLLRVRDLLEEAGVL